MNGCEERFIEEEKVKIEEEIKDEYPSLGRELEGWDI